MDLDLLKKQFNNLLGVTEAINEHHPISRFFCHIIQQFDHDLFSVEEDIQAIEFQTRYIPLSNAQMIEIVIGCLAGVKWASVIPNAANQTTVIRICFNA